MAAVDKPTTETARVLANLIPALPEAAAFSLMRLLVLIVNVDTSNQRRADRLGLLIMMLDGTGEFPNSSRYSQLRKERAAMGEDWPDHSTLCRAYGSWLDAVKAAQATLTGRGKPAGYCAPTRSGSYTMLQCLGAVRKCREDTAPWPGVPYWPSQSEYRLYRRVARAAAARAGQPSPPLPDIPTMLRKCGRWEQVIEQAKVKRFGDSNHGETCDDRDSRHRAAN